MPGKDGRRRPVQHQEYGKQYNSTWMGYSPPESIRVIHQLKSVDANALVGYIGGYVGLVLGKNLLQNNVMIYAIFSRYNFI